MTQVHLSLENVASVECVLDETVQLRGGAVKVMCHHMFAHIINHLRAPFLFLSLLYLIYDERERSMSGFRWYAVRRAVCHASLYYFKSVIMLFLHTRLLFTHKSFKYPCRLNFACVRVCVLFSLLFPTFFGSSE